MAKFGLELHPDKTRLIEFGRFAARNRKQRGEGKPETFASSSNRVRSILVASDANFASGCQGPEPRRRASELRDPKELISSWLLRVSFANGLTLVVDQFHSSYPNG
jgi:hypothetical protein